MTYELIVAVDHFRIPDLDDAHPDEPLRLSEAIWLPEIAGRFSEKELRTAIDKGLLEAERHGRGYRVTRTEIEQWRLRCRVNVNLPDSGSNPRSITRTVVSSRTRSGSSATAPSASARDAAFNSLAALKKR